MARLSGGSWTAKRPGNDEGAAPVSLSRLSRLSPVSLFPCLPNPKYLLAVRQSRLHIFESFASVAQLHTIDSSELALTDQSDATLNVRLMFPLVP